MAIKAETPDNEDKDALEVGENLKNQPENKETQPEIVASGDEDLSKAVETLKKQLDDEKKAREQDRLARIEAERRANEANNASFRANSEKQDTELRLIEGAIETVKANLTTLKAAYAQALRDGDPDKAADLQEHMATAAAQKLQLENGKQALAEKPKQPVPTIADPVERVAGQLTPRSAAWVRAHPQFATDQRLYQKMVAAHNMVTADGIVPDTDEYFSAVEDALKINAPQSRREARTEEFGSDPMSEAARPVRDRSAPPAAPVSRGNGSGGRSVRLSAEEAEIAAMTGMTPEQYWKEKERIRATAH